MWLLIFFIFVQYRLACKCEIIFQISICNWMQICVYLILGVTIADQTRISQKLDWIYFLNERYFSLFIFKVDFVLKIDDNQSLLSLS